MMPLSMYDADEIIRLYLEGYSLREVAAKVGCTFQNVHQLLRRRGILLRPPYVTQTRERILTVD